MDFVLLTGANDLYIKTMIDFIEKLPNDFDNSKLIVYNLGLNSDNENILNNLKNKYNFIFKKFDFDLYPEHVDLKKYNGIFCSYAFKAIVVYNEANINSDKVILWMDIANRFDNNAINKILLSTYKYGIYSPFSNIEKTIESIELNHPKSVKHYGISEYEHKNYLTSRSSNIVSIDYSSKSGKEILDEWYKASLNKNIIMPEGSSRNNHRQDQTILSILMYLYEKNNNIKFDTLNFGVRYWNKLDNSTVQKGLFPFKLIDKRNNCQLAIIHCSSLDEAIECYADRKYISVDEFNKYFSVYPM